MKKYKRYMDSVNVPDTLRERLVNLHIPPRQRVWRKCGTAAAVLLLITGLGFWGADRLPGGQVEKRLETSDGEMEIGQPDIALEQISDAVEREKWTLSGYEVATGGMISYYMLPYIDYGNMESSESASCLRTDWDIPEGIIKKDLSRSDIARLLGGEEVMSAHLNWDKYELTGWAAWYENGSFWGACVMGDAGAQEHFEFAITTGQFPLTCITYSSSVEQDIGGVTVTASGHDSAANEQGGVDISSRQVSFMKDGIGYRLDLTGISRTLTEERVSRFVRWTVMDGLIDLSALTTVKPEGTNGDNLLAGAGDSVEEPH